jgi:uncharacterized small protein (DUF1192 family)
VRAEERGLKQRIAELESEVSRLKEANRMDARRFLSVQQSLDIAEQEIAMLENENARLKSEHEVLPPGRRLRST